MSVEALIKARDYILGTSNALRQDIVDGLNAAIKAAQKDKQPGQPNGHVVCPTPTCSTPNDCLMKGSCQRKAAQPEPMSDKCKLNTLPRERPREPMSDERKLWLSIATPEMVSEADFIKDAAPTWDADYARIWARLQAAEANKLRWMRFARALLSAQPSGWVSVPREPTREMWDAAWNSIGLPYRAKLSMHEIKILFEKFHEAMLAAAPKEPK